MKTHEIKLSLGFCNAVLSGDKLFEIRKNDRAYQTGDHIKFIPVKEDTRKPVFHGIRDKEYVITFVLSGWGLKEEYVALGIKEVKNDR